jgi:hypothetical protein
MGFFKATDRRQLGGRIAVACWLILVLGVGHAAYALDVQVVAKDPLGQPLSGSRPGLVAVAVGAPGFVSSDFQPYPQTVSVASGPMVLTPGVLTALPSTYTPTKGFIAVTPKADTTIAVNTQGVELARWETSGESVVEIRYTFMDIKFEPADLDGSVMAGTDLGLVGLMVEGVTSAPPAELLPDPDYGAYRTVKDVFFSDRASVLTHAVFRVAHRVADTWIPDSDHHVVPVQPGNVYYRLASGGEDDPASEPSLDTRIQVRYDLKTVEIVAKDPLGQSLSGVRPGLVRLAVGVAGSVGTNFEAYPQTVVADAGEELILTPGLLSELPSTYAAVPGLSEGFIRVTPKPDTTVAVNTLGVEVAKWETVGQSVVEIRYTFMDLEFEPSDLSGGALSGSALASVGLKVTGLSLEPAGFTPDSDYGAYRTLDDLFVTDVPDEGLEVLFRVAHKVDANWVEDSFHHLNPAHPGNVYYRLASGGPGTPPSESSSDTRIQVRYDLKTVEIVAKDPLGQPLTGDRPGLVRLAVGLAGRWAPISRPTRRRLWPMEARS